MNKAIGVGRLTKDVDMRYTQSAEPLAVANFTVAVDRRGRDKGTDFISCVAFGKTAENIGKYFKKGSRILYEGRIQTGSYEKDGRTVYTTDVVVENFDFCDSKQDKTSAPTKQNSGFMSIPDGMDTELPFV